MYGLWDVIFAEQASEECFGSLRIPVFLKENVKHGSMFNDSPPKPVSDNPYFNAHFIQILPGTISWLTEQQSEPDIPLAQGLVTDVDSLLVKNFPDITWLSVKRWYSHRAYPITLSGKRCR